MKGILLFAILATIVSALVVGTSFVDRSINDINIHSVTTRKDSKIGIGEGWPSKYKHTILIGKGAEARKDYELVITFEDGSEIRMDLPTDTRLRGWSPEPEELP